jgi:hypothetical protein
MRMDVGTTAGAMTLRGEKATIHRHRHPQI